MKKTITRKTTTGKQVTVKFTTTVDEGNTRVMSVEDTRYADLSTVAVHNGMGVVVRYYECNYIHVWHLEHAGDGIEAYLALTSSEGLQNLVDRFTTSLKKESFDKTTKMFVEYVTQLYELLAEDGTLELGNQNHWRIIARAMANGRRGLPGAALLAGKVKTIGPLVNAMNELGPDASDTLKSSLATAIRNCAGITAE